MNALLNASIDQLWPQLASLTDLVTPDNSAGRGFTIRQVLPSHIEIETEAGSPLTIQRDAFLETLRYLVVNGHTQTNPCEIRSSQLAQNSGPLCAASRNANNGTRVINYIVPILEAVGILISNGQRPNSTWLA